MTLTTTDASSFTLQTKNASEIIVLWNQHAIPEKGMKLKSIDALLCSIQSGTSRLSEPPPITIDYPGEYEFKGLFIVGESIPLHQGTDGVLFAIDTEGIRILAIPNSLTEPLTQEHYAKIGSVDVVLTSTTIHSVAAISDIINQSEPRVVITTEDPSTTTFIKKLGLQAERVSKLKLSKKDLPQEHTACYILTNE